MDLGELAEATEMLGTLVAEMTANLDRRKELLLQAFGLLILALALLVASSKWSPLVYVALVVLVISSIWSGRVGSLEKKFKYLEGKAEMLTTLTSKKFEEVKVPHGE